MLGETLAPDADFGGDGLKAFLKRAMRESMSFVVPSVAAPPLRLASATVSGDKEGEALILAP